MTTRTITHSRLLSTVIWRRRFWFISLLTIIFGILLIGPSGLHSDFSNHAKFAEALIRGHELPFVIPHILFHILLVAVHVVFPLSYLAAGQFVVLEAYVLCGVLLYHKLQRIDMALGLMLVAPIFILTPDQIYAGYVVPITHHNPTAALARPFALLLFWFVVAVLNERHVPLLAMAAVTLASILAKPNFALALAPALVFMLVIRWRHYQRSVLPLVMAVILPTVAMLGLQYALMSFGGRGGIAFVFGGSLSVAWAMPVVVIIAKLLLSIAFPLTILILYPTARLDTGIILAWLTFIVAEVQSLVLVEIGDPRASNW